MADYKVVDSAQLDADLKVVADAIRSKGGTTEKLEFPLGMKQAVEAIQSGGGSGDIMQYATLSNGRLFGNATFPDNYHAFVKIAGCNMPTINYLFYSSSVAHVTLEIGNYNTCLAHSIFSVCQKLKSVEFKNNPLILENATGMFDGCVSLESIYGVLDVSNAKHTVQLMFKNCPKLKDVEFVNESIIMSIMFAQSNLLSDKSIESIINGLADLTSGDAQTITFHADVKSKLTETQLAIITNKNWTLA